jgi:hypothetical protein
LPDQLEEQQRALRVWSCETQVRIVGTEIKKAGGFGSCTHHVELVDLDLDFA